MKTCSKCKLELPEGNFRKDKTKKDGLTSSCKECKKSIENKYYKNNKDKMKKYRDSRKDIKKEYDLNYKKRRAELRKERKTIKKEVIKKEVNYISKFKLNVRNLIKNSFKRNGNKFVKKDKTENLLGCTVEDFRIYIQSKFTEGMSFDNHGKWHLDHITPLALAKTEEEVIKLNHYTNFQPLWSKDNLKKGSNVI